MRAEKDAAESLAASRIDEIATLKTDLEKVKAESDNRFRIGSNWRQRATALQQAQASTATQHSDMIAAKDKELEELRGRIAGLTQEIEEAKGKISEVERSLADSERGSQLKDGTVQRLQSELKVVRNHGAGGAQPPAPAGASDDTAIVRDRKLQVPLICFRLLYGQSWVHCNNGSCRRRRILRPPKLLRRRARQVATPLQMARKNSWQSISESMQFRRRKTIMLRCVIPEVHANIADELQCRNTRMM